MIRIDVVIVSEAKLSEKILGALHAELSARLRSFSPDLRIRSGAVNSISVSGVTEDAERDKILSIIQGVWEDDSWISDI